MKKRAFGKLYKELFYIPKHEKLPDKVFRCRMVVSLLTILACTAVMAASTLALFFSEVSTENSTITGAHYSVTIENTENETYICPLAYEDKHTFEIKAGGTATTGYCVIQVGENTYYTEQIPQGSALTLTVQAAKDTVITFSPGWGVLTEKPCGNEIIHSATPSTIYEVEPTARLASIAAHYGVTEESIRVYNNLLAAAVEVESESNPPLLTVGMELKIPNPAENVDPYKVPYSTYVVEPTADINAISAHYGISIEDIYAFNDMTTYGVGMSLKIPNADPYLPDYAVPYATYTVEPTATIENISVYYGVSTQDILLYNDITEISVGMPLNIPGVAANTTPYAVPFATYAIEATATLEGISAYYGVSIVDITTYNGSVDMTVGNVIKIPGVSPDTPSYVAPVPEPPKTDDTVSGGDTGTTEQPTDTPTGDTPAETTPTFDESTPSSDEPSANEPSSDEPSTDEPSTDEPSSDEPSTDEPSTDTPSADDPSADEPSADIPSSDVPSTDTPSNDASSEEQRDGDAAADGTTESLSGENGEQPTTDGAETPQSESTDPDASQEE